MIDKRLGEGLWVEWFGEGVDFESAYYTLEHVDLDEEIVRRALASALQRDGVVDSLFGGFDTIEGGTIVLGWAGIVLGEREYVSCDEGGETFYGALVEKILPCTWVGLSYS